MKNAAMLFLLLAAMTACGSAMESADSLVRSIVQEVSQDSVRATIARLQAFGTREAKTDSNRAAVQYVVRRMADFGCDTAYLQPFDTLYGFGPNVIGVMRGRLFQDVAFIVLAHIDCIADPPDSAPGANDNASGVAALLETCRVLGGHWYNYTIVFLCENAEEYTLGAAVYAMEARARGDSTLGALNLDMISYALEGSDSVIALGKTVNPDCSALLNGFCSSALEYTDLKVRRVAVAADTGYGFDHIYFWMFGYPAVTVTEVFGQPPCHHAKGDTIGPYHYAQCGANDLPMCTEVAKATAATMAVMAQVDGMPAVAEAGQVAAVQRTSSATVIRSLPTGATVFDAMGRRVLDPKPGVYFVGGGLGARGQGLGRMRKVVLQR